MVWAKTALLAELAVSALPGSFVARVASAG
jgi:hypothetical protein